MSLFSDLLSSYLLTIILLLATILSLTFILSLTGLGGKFDSESDLTIFKSLWNGFLIKFDWEKLGVLKHSFCAELSNALDFISFKSLF